MHLNSFTVSNFRSITDAKKVPLTGYSVLVGANNEGKSNILHALALGMQIIEGYKHRVVTDSLGRIRSIRPTLLGRRSNYDWSQDFPISKRSSRNEKYTDITMEFSLSDAEVVTFQEDIGIQLNGYLPILIRLSQYEEPNISVPKQGRGTSSLKKNINKIANFVSQNVSFEYIPAVRTATNAEEIVADLLRKELRSMEDDATYRKAIDKIKEIQEPILKKLSSSVTSTISSFLPSVKTVEIKMESDARIRAMRRGISIEVNDGNTTSLERKGDGVKSLVALALMRHVSASSNAGGSAIIAIEEPEAHLHPQAIHEIREVVRELSKRNQVILATHSPLFVNPSNLESTIIVQDSKANVAKSIGEVRNILGVRLSDNLQSARLVAIVEGDDDIIILEALLKERFPELAKAVKSGDLVFDALGGASNLSYKIRTYRNSATLVQCFLDGDKAGKDAVKKAIDDAILRESDYNLINVMGFDEAELEDVLDPKKYKDGFIAEFGVDPTISPPKAKKLKWSAAMKMKFLAHGKLWDSKVEMKAKLWLARFARDNIGNIVLEQRITPVEAFAKSLILKLKNE